MNSWLIALQLWPLLIKGIVLAEKLLGKGEGVKKKAFVVDGIEQTIKGMSEISTGGQKETWEIINNAMPAIKSLIDILVGLFFPKEE